MGNALTNQTPNSTYGDLLHLSNSGGGITSSNQSVVDGLGVDSALQICTTGVHIMSGFVLKDEVVTATANDLNKTTRTLSDGVVEASRVVVADVGNNIATSGGSIQMTSPESSTPYGSISNFKVGNLSNRLTVHAGGVSATGIDIHMSSGQYHRVLLENASTMMNIMISSQATNDSTSLVDTAYYLKLFFIQGTGGGFEWKWPASTEIRWEGDSIPSGILYGGSAYAYASGFPLINDNGAVYSGGLIGGHTASAGEIDIVEMYSLNQGTTWYAKRLASGIIDTSLI